MSTLDETWAGLVAGTATAPTNPHLRKMVLVHARNRASHPEVGERLTALGVIRRVGGSDALSVAMAFAGDVSLDVRRRLMQLALEAGQDGLPVLRKLAADPDPHLAIDAIRRLTEAQDRAATPKMRNLLKARHAVVRGRAAVFLGLFGGGSLVPFLRRHGDDPDDAARSAIAWAIARLEARTEDPPPDTGQTWAGLALEGAPPAPVPEPNGFASEAEVSPSEVEASPSEVEASPSEVEASPLDSSAALIPTAAPTPEPEPPPVGAPPGESDGGVLGILREIAVHPDRREALVARLRAADERELSQAFRSRKPGVHPDLSVGAALAAADLGNPRWLAPVRKLAVDPEPRVRAAVSEAIGALCSPSAYRTLEKLVEDGDASVQIAAARALAVGARKLGYEAQARRLLTELPESRDVHVKAAREAATAELA